MGTSLEERFGPAPEEGALRVALVHFCACFALLVATRPPFVKVDGVEGGGEVRYALALAVSLVLTALVAPTHVVFEEARSLYEDGFLRKQYSNIEGQVAARRAG